MLDIPDSCCRTKEVVDTFPRGRFDLVRILLQMVAFDQTGLIEGTQYRDLEDDSNPTPHVHRGSGLERN